MGESLDVLTQIEHEIDPEELDEKDRKPPKLAKLLKGKTRKPWAFEAVLRPYEPLEDEPFKAVAWDVETNAIGRANDGILTPYLVAMFWRDGSRSHHEVFHSLDGKPGHVIDRFLEAALTPRFEGHRFYAHNGGKFDVQFLMQRFLDGPWESLGYEGTFVRVNATVLKLTIWHCSNKKAKWHFVDSMRLLPSSLDKIGKAFTGTGKLDAAKELGVTRGQLHRVLPRARYRDVAVRYCVEDCRVLFDSLEKVHELLTGELGCRMMSTTAGTAMDLWRRAFIDCDIYLNRHFLNGPRACPDLGKAEVTCAGCAHAVFREAFTGGRVEIFRMLGGHHCPRELRGTEASNDNGVTVGWIDSKGKWRPHRSGLLYFYDFKSHYPTMMLRPMPVGQVEVCRGGNLGFKVLAPWKRGKVGFIRCTVTIPPGCEIPPLPVRLDERTRRPLDEEQAGDVAMGSRAAKLVFPGGTFTGIWDAAELELLEEIPGASIDHVHESFWFSAKPIFAEFVRTLYAYRDKKRPGYSKAMDELAKLIMNSLFGKTGQREIRSRYHVSPDGDDIRAKEMLPLVPEDRRCDVWVEETWQEADWVAPQIAAHVTALGRAALWRKFREARAAGAHVYYCDTDSLVVDLPVWGESSGELGTLELQHVISSARFVLPKAYEVRCARGCPCDWETKEKKTPRAKRKWKGNQPRSGARQLGHATWFEAAYYNGRIERTRVASLVESVKAHYRAAIAWPRAVVTCKEMRQAYDKRSVADDGVTTMPLQIVDGVAYGVGDQPQSLGMCKGLAGEKRGEKWAPGRPPPRSPKTGRPAKHLTTASL
jgi:hypothetical protein